MRKVGTTAGDTVKVRCCNGFVSGRTGVKVRLVISNGKQDVRLFMAALRDGGSCKPARKHAATRKYRFTLHIPLDPGACVPL